MKSTNTATTLITLTIVVLLLIVAQSIILPFLFALLIWFVVKKTRNLMDKIDFIERFIPHWIKTIVSTSIIFGLLIFVTNLLILSIEDLSTNYLSYSNNISIISTKINESFGVDLGQDIQEMYHSINLNDMFGLLVNSLSEILGNMLLTAFYVVFLFLEERLFGYKFKLIFSEKSQRLNFESILKKVDKSMSSYLSLKSLIALMSASISFVIFSLVGIEAPIFWAFLIFIFNFIPSIGPIVATVLPSLFAFMQFGDFNNGLIIFFGVGLVVMLIGNFVEPKLMGNTLNISPLVAILSLAVWGTIWGIPGMLLAVPITVALIIILAQFPSTRPVAILLSEKGRV